jgi:cell division protein FtsB
MIKGKAIRWAVLIIGIIITVRLINNITRLVNVGGRVTQEEKKLADAQLLNKQLKESLLEVQTPQFMEREAREKLGYGKPGEVVLVIPDNLNPKSVNQGSKSDEEPNWVKWRKLYFGL